ncbi:MAG: threonylcarbamoyl-AMP synthase [Candidatus Komeilibacteria bacterium]|jgi:L-threonylcarbamoyladenylate synthase|nr:threonylcarbamoyl-AMP synthase [Candidatus Komeilibacteria bacterium]MBT4447985.1 threonylcarbamoyl-AMP synthase [Candidatus Komeilibacteria bacterium]
MEEIILTKDNKAQVLQKALEILEAGGTIIYPTETSYGLGCDFYNQTAAAKIYKIKGRGKKPLSVIVPDIIAASTLVEFSDQSRRLALENWPGALTLVLPFKYKQINHHIDSHLALRISSHPIADALANSFAKPIVATSANISDNPDSYKPEDIKKQFKDAKFKPDLFINAGELPERATSTIIKFVGDKGEILRQGDIKIKL